MFQRRENQQVADEGSSFVDEARELGRFVDEMFTSFMQGVSRRDRTRINRSAPVDIL